MSIKKSLKKSVVLGALMSFVITGNAYAATSFTDVLKSALKGEEAFKTTLNTYLAENGYSSAEELADKLAQAGKDAVEDFQKSEAYKNAIADAEKAAVEAFKNSETYKEALNGAVEEFKKSEVYQNAIKNAEDAAVEAFKNSETYKEILENEGDAAAKAALEAFKNSETYTEALKNAGLNALEEFKNSEDYKQALEDAVASFKETDAYKDALKSAGEMAVDVFKNSEEYKNLVDQLQQYKDLEAALGGGNLQDTIKNLADVKEDLDKIAGLAETATETIEQVKAKAAEYESKLAANINYTENVLANKINAVEGKLSQYEDAIAGKIDKVEDKLSQYEGAIAGKIDKVEDKLNQYEEAIKDNIQYTDGKVGELADAVKENIQKVEGEIKDQAAALKDVQENVIKDISYDKATDTTKVDNNVNMTKDLTVGGNAAIGGDLDVTGAANIGTDLTVGNSIMVGAGTANQVVINENGITVGLNSTVMDKDGVYAGGHTFEEAGAAIGADGSIKGANGLFAVDATTGDVTGGLYNGVDVVETAEQVAANTTQIAVNKQAIDAEVERATQAEAALQTQITENTGKIAENEAAIETNKADIATNKQAITDEAIAREEGDRANAQAITGLNQRLGQLSGRVNKVGAGAAALAALHPLEYDPEDKLTFSAGMGNYAGQNAAALGAFYRPNEKLMFSLAGTMGNGENMVNLGVSVGLDGATGLAKMSKKELIQKVNSMEAEMAELRALVVKLAADKK